MKMKFTLSACRLNAGFTLEEASKELDVNKTTLSKYEKDSSNIPMSLLNNASELYQVPIDYIFIGKKYELKRIIRNKEFA